MQAQDIMSRPVVTVHDFDSIRTAAAVLAEHGFTAVPVTGEDKRLIGIVTEADLIRGAIPHDARSAVRDEPRSAPPAVVDQVMTRKVRTAAPDTDCADIAEMMLKHDLRAVPVVQNRVVVGIVTRRDLMRGLTLDDIEIGRIIRRNLDRCGGFEDWPVQVRHGAVVMTDPVRAPSRHHVARALALAAPGTRQVTVVEGPARS
ncbi:CBS domain-containing protein [Saccharopolyspora sp. NPDC002376]